MVMFQTTYEQRNVFYGFLKVFGYKASDYILARKYVFYGYSRLYGHKDFDSRF